MSIPSDISDTDFAVFEQLANVKRMDFSKGALPKRGHSEPILDGPHMDDHHDAPPPPYQEYPSAPRTGKGRSPLRISVGQFAEDQPPPRDSPKYQEPHGYNFGSMPPPPPPESPRHQPRSGKRPSNNNSQRHHSRFAEQVHQQMTHHPGVFQPPPPPPPAPGAYHPSGPKRPTPARQYPLNPPGYGHMPPAFPPPAPARPQQMDENDLRKMHANYGMSDEDSVRRKKKRLMDEVKDLETKGYIFEVRPTMEDSLEDIQDKVDNGHSALEMKHTITFARENIPNAYGFIEMANNMWGPWLPIQGFTDQLERKIKENPQRYEYVLERMYRKYWRKGSMSPAMEFFMVFILPFFMYAGKQKFFNGMGGGSSPKPQDTANSAAPEPPRQNIPEPMNYPQPPTPSRYPPQPPPQQQQPALNPFNVGPSLPPQPPMTGQFFPPPMMQQPQHFHTSTAPFAPHLNTSSSKKQLKPPSKFSLFPTSQQPLNPQPIPVPPIHVPTHVPSTAPRSFPTEKASSIPPPIPVHAGVSHREAAGPIMVQIPSTPPKPRVEPIPSEGRLPPIVEQPEEDESEL
jgi:hypothetical protein